MKYSRVQLQNTISTVLLAVSFCIQMPLAAHADDATVFVPETPSLDSSPPAQESPAQAQSSTVLNGSVRKRNTLPGPDGNTASTDVTQSGGASANDAQLQSETAAADADRRYQLAAKKLASRAKMTSDDFRDLQIGIAGAETTRTFTKKTAKVDQVFPGCPAALAGIRKGDVQVLDPSQTQDPADVTQPLWAFSGGRAGSKVQMNILRDGQIIPFTLTRMNIEDIPDPKLRHRYEEFARQLPASGEGTVQISDQTPFLLKLAKFLIPLPL